MTVHCCGHDPDRAPATYEAEKAVSLSNCPACRLLFCQAAAGRLGMEFPIARGGWYEVRNRMFELVFSACSLGGVKDDTSRKLLMWIAKWDARKCELYSRMRFREVICEYGKSILMECKSDPAEINRRFLAFQQTLNVGLRKYYEEQQAASKKTVKND